MSERSAYNAWLDRVNSHGTPTPPLHEFARWWNYDSNLPWRVAAGHLVNLLEDAITRMESTELIAKALYDAHGHTRSWREASESQLRDYRADGLAVRDALLGDDEEDGDE